MYYDDDATLRFLNRELDSILDTVAKERQQERMAQQRERLCLARRQEEQARQGGERQQ
jgi:hypothetical protein